MIRSMSTVIWLLTITCLTWSVSMKNVAQQQPDITLLTLYNKETNNMTLTCVGGNNTYNSALTFITPLETKYATITPQSIYRGNFNCEFEDISKCAKLWEESGHTVKEYGRDYIAPVIDERWENFKIRYTDNNKMKQIAYEAKQEYLAISVRSESNVRIHLCNEPNNECYVIIIPGKSQSSQPIRIQGCTNVMGNKYDPIQFNCKYLNSGEGGSLMGSLWNHYTITADQNNNNIKVFKLGQEKPVLEYSVLSRLISRIFVSSHAGAFWKIHIYKYLQLHVTDQYKTIGPPYQALSTGTMCLSLYVAEGIDGQLKWQNVRLITDVLENQNYSLRIKGTNSDRSTQEFWAIDDIRECRVEESRTITMEVMSNTNEESVFCQTLNFPNLKVSNKGSIPENIETFFCKDKTYIGANCDIPCKSVDPYNDTYCNKHRICKPTNDGSETRCTCAFGYKGVRCNEACSKGRYGYNCQNVCGYCINNRECGKISGTCRISCENGYEEPLCTTLLYPILKTPPTLISSTLSNITVRLDNIDTEGKQPAVKFQLQYTINTKGPWINYNKPQTLENSTVVTVENLESDKNYAIRAILYTVDENSYTGSRVPYVGAFTNCAGVSENADGITDITVTSTADTINIQWKPVCKIQIEMLLMCKESWCEMQRTNNFIPSIDGKYTFTKLLPYTLYEIHISSKMKTFALKTIKTEASVPPAVRDLTVYSQDEGYLALRWKSPFPPHGELESYHLTYKTCSHQNSHSLVITNLRHCRLWDNFLCYRITNVEGNQCYQVHIRAKNENVSKYSENISAKTHTKQNPSQAPRNMTATWNNQDELTLNWTHPLVTNGDLRSFVIVFESSDTNKYKFNETYSVNFEKRFYIYKIKESIQFSAKYNLSIYGKNKHVGESKSIIVDTPPKTPALIGNVTAGKRTNTTQVITIPTINISMTDRGDMYVVVCDPKQQSSNINEINPHNCSQNIIKQTNCLGTAWIAVILPINTTGTNVTVSALRPDIEYQVSVVLVNYYNGKCRYKVYTLTLIFKPEEYHSNPALYALLLLLLLPVIIWFIYRGLFKSKHGSIANDQENFILSQ